MPTIIEDLPFNPADLLLRFPRGVARRKRRQIILMVSVTEEATTDIPDRTRYFPAVFDTGFNESLLVQEEQLVRWAEVNLDDHPIVGELRLPFINDETGERRTAPIRRADVWIHPNVPGSSNQLSDEDAFRIELPTGIAVPPTDLTEFPRLPLLGMHVLDPNRLEVILDGPRESMSIRTVGR